MQSIDLAVVWRVAAACSLAWRDWGADAVVFDRASGRTHQLTPLAAAALATLLASPHTLESLVVDLAQDLLCEPDAGLHQAVETALDEFADRLWIEALTPAITR